MFLSVDSLEAFFIFARSVFHAKIQAGERHEFQNVQRFVKDELIFSSQDYGYVWFESIEARIMKTDNTIDPSVLDDILRRIVEVADPEQVIMFGSAARGEMGENSDVDLMVVKSGASRLKLAREICANLHGEQAAVDVLVCTPEDIDRYKDNPATVIAPAVQEGKVVYNEQQGRRRRPS